MYDTLVAIVAFIVLVGVMVVVHEFGHFAVAKLCGVRVEAFSIGFGTRLFGIKYGETDYKVCLLPLGGYVKMTGETPDQIAGPTGEGLASDPGAFTSHPRWQRMLIGVAGPAANFVLAFVLMVIYFGFINEVPVIKPVTLEWIAPNSAAAQAGLKPGDVISGFAGIANPDLEAVGEKADEMGGQTIPVQVTRGGQAIDTTLHLATDSTEQASQLALTGLFFHFIDSPIRVDLTMPGSPAEKAGLRHGDTILTIDGYKFHTLEPLLEYLKEGQGKPITLSVLRDGVTSPVIIQPTQQSSGWRLGFQSMPGDDLKMERRPMTLSKALPLSLEACKTGSRMIFDVLGKLFTRQASVKELSGPIGIARVAGKAAQTKYWLEKFELAASISLNLGILNLLPFPILDGGLILLLLIESLIQKDISMIIKERIYQAAFVMLVMFFVYVSYNDIVRLPIFNHFRP